MHKPSHYLISATINAQKHNLAIERHIHHSTHFWSPVRPPLGHAPNAEILTHPTRARATFKQVLRGVVLNEPPFFKPGIDPDSLILEGVFIEYRPLDPNKLESDEDRKGRVLEQLARGEQISRDDADFLQRLIR